MAEKVIYTNSAKTIRIVLYDDCPYPYVIKYGSTKSARRSIIREKRVLEYIGLHTFIIGPRLPHPSTQLCLCYYPNGSILDVWKGLSGPLPLVRVWRYMSHILEALAFLESMQVIHGDVAPKNFLLGRADGAILSDFGSAALVGTKGVTQRNGTPFFWSPEIYAKKVVRTPAVDVWALGITALSLAGFSKNMWNFVSPYPRQLRELKQYVDEAAYILPIGTDPVFAEWLETVLVVDPTERSTAAEALKHPFFLNEPERHSICPWDA